LIPPSVTAAAAPAARRAPARAARDRKALHVQAAKHQSLFREVNERVKTLSTKRWEHLPTIDFICECADAECSALVALSVSEYEAIRATSTRFLVAAEHPHPDIEIVVAKNDRFWTVEKIDDGRACAEALDPRGRNRR
jgi:hypothetical protein